MKNKTHKADHQLLIVGGGMVGLVMAASLAPVFAARGETICLIDQGDLNGLLKEDWLTSANPSASDFDHRVSAISPANQNFLACLNIWSKIPEQRRADYERMQVWDSEGSGHISFDAAELAQPYLGCIVENRLIRAAALQQIMAFANVKLLQQNTIENIQQANSYVKANLSNGDTISARLVIGADGAFSSVRRLLGVASINRPYTQKALVANVESELPHQDTAWQRFTPYGPVAFLPMPQPNLCSVVWSLDEDKASKLSLNDPEKFQQQLAQAFELRLGKVKLITSPVAFPLMARHSETYLANRCALIGDAAHTIHPLAGQGVNLGFQDVACLSERIKHLLAKGRDIGLLANLRPFERERKAHNQTMLDVMGGFKWLFGQQSLGPTLLRNQGMQILDKSAALKREITRRAMGI